MAHKHTHAHGSMQTGATSLRMRRVLWISFGLTLLFVIAESIAGFQAKSLALLSDAGHNFTDAFALALAAFSILLQTRPGDSQKTYGYQRAGVLAAFVNALTLVVLAFALFYESYHRFVEPEDVDTGKMMVMAAIALVLNLGIAWALGSHGDHHHDLNVRAAWLHMAGDAASSAAIIVGAYAIRVTGWSVIDPILSVLIGIAIVWSGGGIIHDTLNILLEGLPKGLALDNVRTGLATVPGVIDIHDLHIWSLGSESRALSSHVLIEDMPPSESDAILRGINAVLAKDFAIHHSTIQFEHVRCVLAESHCTAAVPENVAHKPDQTHEGEHQH